MEIPEHIFPFERHWFDRGDGVRMHFVDEGGGDPVVMVHGNPTWSIYYRNLVGLLRERYRCIAPDHVGCGFSDKPGDDRYAYTLAQRIDDLDALIGHLDLGDRITLVVHDWGGMIGMAWAARNPERVRRMVILNTAAFPMPETKRFPPPLWLTRTPVGALLVRGFNAFARGAAATCCTRRPMDPEIRRAYVAPYDSWDNRIATLRFVQDIPLSPGDPGFGIVSETGDRLRHLADVPTLICWGEKDFVFDHHFLAEWERRMPHAEVHRLPDSGHYVLEDSDDLILPLVDAFLDGHPITEAVA